MRNRERKTVDSRSTSLVRLSEQSLTALEHAAHINGRHKAAAIITAIDFERSIVRGARRCHIYRLVATDSSQPLTEKEYEIGIPVHNLHTYISPEAKKAIEWMHKKTGDDQCTIINRALQRWNDAVSATHAGARVLHVRQFTTTSGSIHASLTRELHVQ